MKKIAYFSGQLFGEYIIEVTRALIHRAEELGYQVDVFTNFGVYGNNFMYAEGEKSIIQLPNLSEYAGVIAASDNFEISGFAKPGGYRKMMNRRRKQVCLIVWKIY